MIIAAMRRLASAFVHRSMSPESGTRREMCGVSASGCVCVSWRARQGGGRMQGCKPSSSRAQALSSVSLNETKRVRNAGLARREASSDPREEAAPRDAGCAGGAGREVGARASSSPTPPRERRVGGLGCHRTSFEPSDGGFHPPHVRPPTVGSHAAPRFTRVDGGRRRHHRRISAEF